MNNPQVKTAMQYGAYSGLSSFCFFLLLYFVSSNPLGNKSWLGAWIPIVFIVLGTKYFRDSENGGFIAYWRGVGTGTFIALFSSLLFALLIYLFGTLADPQILENYKVESLQGIEEAKKFLTSETMLSRLDEAIEKIEKFSMSELALSFFYNGIFGGFVISLIVAAVLKKQKPLFEETGSATF